METDYIDQNPASGGSITLETVTLSTLKTRFASLARIYYQFRKAQPADHFYINLKSGTVEDLAGNKLF
ncbi:hypothetical protein [Shewanella sp. 10N.286.48.A6]|uniref:hypothetical protein n=1 Tax=Shewanella sp. 10N.286.48.A6 TaxID=1880833 RepID=UPI000C84E2B7|nr:hypothetical protein [Shewanella sp. 10N.286.48.A6]PMH94739.1 hypothetical protein BCU55_03680 [Shewanella sp. 10N.286.48.A6]